MTEADTQPNMSESTLPVKATITFKKGGLVKVNRDAFLQSIEAKASDPIPPEYIFQGPGEILAIQGEYCQIRWQLPVPDAWLRIDQLKTWS